MKQTIKFSKIILFICTLSFFNCQPEQEVSYQEETTSRKLNIWKYPAERIFQATKAVKDRISTLKQRNTEARLTSSLYNFSIEESEVQVIYEATYTQYSFLIYRSIPVPNVLENYICKVYNDGYVEQFLVAYPFSEDENGMVYDTQNATMQVIQDTSLNYTIISRIPAGCVPEFVDTAWTYECVNVACSGDGHQVGESGCDCNGTNCTAAHTECDWVSVNIWSYSCPTNGGSGDTTGDTGVIGGGTTGTGSTTDDEIITVPVTMNLTEQKFIQSLNPEEFSCYSLNTTQENKNQIINYLNANKTDNVINPEAIEEVKDLTEAICENPNLNFDIDLSLKSPANIDRIEIDTTTTEGKKFDCIYTKLTQSPSFKNLFIDTFGGTQEKLNIKFEITEILPQGITGRTIFSTTNNGQSYLNTILISKNVFDGTKSNFYIAKIILHECIHAYLNIKLKDCNQGTTIPELNGLDLQELIGVFYQSFNCHILVNNSQQSQHDFIFNHLIPTFQNIFLEIKDSLTSSASIQNAQNLNFEDSDLNINEPWNWNNFFKYLSMTGLHLCDSFTQNITNVPAQNYLYQTYNSYTNSFTKDCN